MAIVAQRLQVPLEFRLGLRQFEGRQHPAEVGAVAAIVEQRNVPVRAQRLQEFQQRARRLRKLKAVQPFAQRLRRTPTHHVPHVKFGHLVVRQIHHLITVGIELVDDFPPFGVATRQTHADENAGVVGIGVAVVEFGHRAAAQQLAELEEAALLFRNGHRQQRFALFAQFAAFGNVAQPMEVEVGARQHVRQTLALNVVLLNVLFQPRQRQRAGRFGNGTHVLEQIFDRCANGVAVHSDYVVQIFTAQAEGFVADTLHRHAFGEQPDARQIHRLAGIQRRAQAGGVFRFDADHFDLRHQLLDQHRHPGGQAAAADRHEDPIQMRVLLQQLHRQRALPGNHRRMIERRHEGHALLLGKLDRLRFGLVEIGAVQQHFAAETAHRIHFDVRGGHRHHDQRFNAQPFTGEGYALRVVAGRSRYDAARLLLLVQPGDHRIGPAQLEAVHRLAIFALHQNGVAEARRNFAHGL